GVAFERASRINGRRRAAARLLHHVGEFVRQQQPSFTCSGSIAPFREHHVITLGISLSVEQFSGLSCVQARMNTHTREVLAKSGFKEGAYISRHTLARSKLWQFYSFFSRAPLHFFALNPLLLLLLFETGAHPLHNWTRRRCYLRHGHRGLSLQYCRCG